MILPRHVLGGKGYKAPSDKLNIAGVGVRKWGMGSGNLRACREENIVALCDVDFKQSAPTFKEYPKAKVYKDFRKMFERQKDIDAVIVATPDHNHAVITMMAIKLGKHVYCQKPLTHTVFEARKITEAAREYNVQTQMGNQGRSSDEIRSLKEWINDDAIGPVREIYAWTDRPVEEMHGIHLLLKLCLKKNLQYLKVLIGIFGLAQLLIATIIQITILCRGEHG